MVIAGVILLVLGLGSLIFGLIQNNSLEAQLMSFLSSGSGNPGTIWIIIGAVVAVVGIAVLVIGLKKKKG